MNNLLVKNVLRNGMNAINGAQQINHHHLNQQTRSHTYYLKKKKVPIEILNDDYQPTDKLTKYELKRKQMILKSRDRRIPVPLEASIKYLESEEYKRAYRGLKVWVPYRRAVAGNCMNPPMRTRNRCIVDGFVVINSPCPICRDKNLVIHPKNVKLLEQFINPASDDVYECSKVQLCEKTYEDLVCAVEVARDLGYLQFRVPFRQFDYTDFYSKDLLKHLNLADDQIVQDPLIENKVKNIIEPSPSPYAKTRIPF